MPGYRCILGCEQTGAVLHVFPNPSKFPERFKVWVNIIGGKLETPSEYEYFKKKRMCDIHFKEEHKNRNNRLSALAVPCLNLPGGALDQHFTDNLTTEEVVTTPLVTADKSLLEISTQSDGVKETAHSSTAPDMELVPSIWKEHNYSMIRKPERKQPTKDVLLSHQAKENRRQIKLLQSNIRWYRFNYENLKG